MTRSDVNVWSLIDVVASLIPRTNGQRSALLDRLTDDELLLLSIWWVKGNVENKRHFLPAVATVFRYFRRNGRDASLGNGFSPARPQLRANLFENSGQGNRLSNISLIVGPNGGTA